MFLSSEGCGRDTSCRWFAPQSQHPLPAALARVAGPTWPGVRCALRGAIASNGFRSPHDRRGTPRESTLALGALASGAWHHAEIQAAEASAGDCAARQAAIASFDRTVSRAEALAAALRRDLERCALAQAIMARELGADFR